MQDLVEAATKVAAVLEINHDDIYNEVRRVQKEHKAAVNACATVSPEMSESLAMADDTDNDGRERPVMSAPVSWSPAATTMDNDGPDTATTTCLDGGVSIHTGGTDKDVTVTGPDNGIAIAAASTEPQRNMVCPHASQRHPLLGGGWSSGDAPRWSPCLAPTAPRMILPTVSVDASAPTPASAIRCSGEDGAAGTPRVPRDPLASRPPFPPPSINTIDAW